MIFKLIHQLTNLKPYERLPRWTGYTVEFDPKQLQPDEQLLIQAGFARDIRGAHAFIQKKGVSVYELDLRLPPPRVNVRRRFKMWFMRLCGETVNDRELARYFRNQDELEEKFEF